MHLGCPSDAGLDSVHPQKFKNLKSLYGNKTLPEGFENDINFLCLLEEWPATSVERNLAFDFIY